MLLILSLYLQYFLHLENQPSAWMTYVLFILVCRNSVTYYSIGLSIFRLMKAFLSTLCIWMIVCTLLTHMTYYEMVTIHFWFIFWITSSFRLSCVVFSLLLDICTAVWHSLRLHPGFIALKSGLDIKHALISPSESICKVLSGNLSFRHYPILIASEQ